MTCDNVKTTWILGTRVDYWQDKQTGQYIAKMTELVESGPTLEKAFDNLRNVILNVAATASENWKGRFGEPFASRIEERQR